MGYLIEDGSSHLRSGLGDERDATELSSQGASPTSFAGDDVIRGAHTDASTHAWIPTRIGKIDLIAVLDDVLVNLFQCAITFRSATRRFSPA